MPAVVEMLPCVPMRRGVAAADVTAGQAQAQMHPPRANSQAILATIGARDHIADHVQMWVGHFASLHRRGGLVVDGVNFSRFYNPASCAARRARADQSRSASPRAMPLMKRSRTRLATGIGTFFDS